MPDLDIATATAQIAIGLRDTIALTWRRRYPAVADHDALRVQPTLGVSGTSLLDDTNVELVPVGGTTVYRWDGAATSGDDDDQVITPADRLALMLPGRWTKTTASATEQGFLDAVRVYEAYETEDQVLEGVLGQIPSCLVVWQGEDHRLKSVQPGALYAFTPEFDILVSSKSLRRGNEALLGSPVADEADLDPGVYTAVGRIKKVLAGSSLGLEDGVDIVLLGRHSPKLQSLGEGQFVHCLKVRVAASIHIPDADGEDFPVGDLELQRELVHAADDGSVVVERLVGDPDPIPIPPITPIDVALTMAADDEAALDTDPGTDFNFALIRTLWVRVSVPAITGTSVSMTLSFTAPHYGAFATYAPTFTTDAQAASVHNGPLLARVVLGGYVLDYPVNIGGTTFQQHPDEGTWRLDATLAGGATENLSVQFIEEFHQ